MRLLVQRVAKASAEVNSCVESRIGPGLLLTLSLTVGDSELVAQQLAAKVLALNLWPELLDLDVPWKTNVVENGYEVLVMLQPSLCAAFPKSVPNEDRVLPQEEAEPIVEAFTAKLRASYQDEMVVLAPLEAPLRLEVVTEGLSTFVLGAGDSKAAAAGGKGGGKAATELTPSKPQPLKPELGVVTKALQNIRYLEKRKASSEGARAFQAMSVKSFQEELADASQEQSDHFAGALDAAARAFSQRQREQISQWTGLQFSEELADEAEHEDYLAKEEPQEQGDDELEKQLAELKGEVADRGTGIAATKRRRLGLDTKPTDTVQVRPDWSGKAAPDTPAGARPPWQQAGKGLKGKGGKSGKTRGPYRSLGIASLDQAANLHGHGSAGYHWSQSTKYNDQQLHIKTQGGGGAGAGAGKHEPAARLPKGTPTVAPMCPDADAASEDVDI